MDATFMHDIPPSVAETIGKMGIGRTYPARSFVFHEGEAGTGVLIVESGLMRIDRTTKAGKVVLLDLAVRGSLVGELAVIDGAPRSASASTITHCSLRYISGTKFQELLAAHVEVQTALMHRLARRLRSLTDQFIENSAQDATTRVGARLLELVEIERKLDRIDPGEHDAVDLKLPFSQEELGQWAGLSREGTVKALTTLKSLGLITTGRKRIHIPNLGALRSRSE